jgi:hypothetical protein
VTTTEIIVAPDVVKLVRSYLLDVGFPWSPVKILNRRPNPTTGRIVVVRRSGGTLGDLVSDAAFVTIECFAETSEDAANLAMFTYAAVQSMKWQMIDDVQCYRVDTLAAPADQYDPDAQRDRFTFSVQVAVRSTPIDPDELFDPSEPNDPYDES